METANRLPCPYCPDASKLYIVPRGLSVHISKIHKATVVSQDDEGGGVAEVLGADEVGLSQISELKKRVRVLRHVPKGARNLAAGKLSNIIEEVIKNNGLSDWFLLLSFAFTALKIPERTTHTSLTNKVKQNIDGLCLDLPTEESFKPHSFYRTIETKVHDGDLRGAVRLLLSDCSLAPFNAATLSALHEKHPPPSRPLDKPSDPDTSGPFLSVTETEVATALATFYNGSSSGVDGLRPQHLKELTSVSAGNNGLLLLKSRTKLCNFLLRGMANPQICPYLYGASLCALMKKNGGVRPIAVGNTIRRLVFKLACRSVKGIMADYLQPRQVGFGTPLGCEAAIHAVRCYAVDKNNKDSVILKVDIRNAFNSVERDVILGEAKDHVPHLYPFLHQCYSSTSNLYYGSDIISSQVGVQQGDPVGPLLFCLAIHKAITTLDSPLNIWYLDDGTIGGSSDLVLGDVSKLLSAFSAQGLEINASKCELHPIGSAATAHIASFEALLPGLKVVDRVSFALLGAPIFSEGVSGALQNKTIALKTSIKHLHNLSAHVSLVLLRNCFSLPRITYTLRTAPTWRFPQELHEFDQVLQEGLETVLNVSLDDAQWCQATLPIRHGGLGVRCVQDVGLVAFLASSYASSCLVARILGFEGTSLGMPCLEEACTEWSLRCTSNEQPDNPESQRSWDEILCRKKFSDLLEGVSGTNLARLKAVAEPESGAWLHALPSSHLGTVLDNDTLRIAAALRLGCRVCEPHRCVCGATVEENGHHGLSCSRCAGRFPRHHALNDIVRRAMLAASVPCVLEPQGLSRVDGKRPDGLTLVPWAKGRSLIWDATCVSTFAASHLGQTTRAAGGAAEAAARYKHTKYDNLKPVYDFVPLAVETAGPWCSEAKQFVKAVGRRLRERGCDPRSGSYLVQRISLAIQRGNAAGIMGTFEPGTCPI